MQEGRKNFANIHRPGPICFFDADSFAAAFFVAVFLPVVFFDAGFFVIAFFKTGLLEVVFLRLVFIGFG